MAAFDHFLLTRFSAVLAPHAPPAQEAWLRYRLGFFYDAALPSVAAQRDAAFTWLVLFDDRCPDGFRAAVEDLAADGTFTPVWSHEHFRRDTFAAHVAERSDTPYLITTRMDSDDAIAVDFMAAVQAQFARQDRLFVNFARGIQLDRSGSTYGRDQLSGPFLSLIEVRASPAPPLTVYAPKHARARRHGPLLEVRAPAMWAQVVHDANLANVVVGPRLAPAVVAQRFAIDLGYRAQVPVPRLLAEKVQQRGRMLRRWSAHPGELTAYVEARFWRLRGTHERPQNAAARTFTDTIQHRAARLGWNRR